MSTKQNKARKSCSSALFIVGVARLCGFSSAVLFASLSFLSIDTNSRACSAFWAVFCIFSALYQRKWITTDEWFRLTQPNERYKTNWMALGMKGHFQRSAWIMPMATLVCSDMCHRNKETVCSVSHMNVGDVGIRELGFVRRYSIIDLSDIIGSNVDHELKFWANCCSPRSTHRKCWQLNWFDFSRMSALRWFLFPSTFSAKVIAMSNSNQN